MNRRTVRRRRRHLDTLRMKAQLHFIRPFDPDAAHASEAAANASLRKGSLPGTMNAFALPAIRFRYESVPDKLITMWNCRQGCRQARPSRPAH
jgi:hypothetical protein